MKIRPAHMTDFYKTGHIYQYPKGTTLCYSNFTPRSDKNAKMLPDFDHKVVNFGLQGLLQWMYIDTWNEFFFGVDRDKVIREYKSRMDRSLGPGSVDPKHIGELHELGYLPIRIKALPEGARVPVRIPLFTIVNTHDDFFWTTNYLESDISANFWKSPTTATTAYEFRRLFTRYAELTGVPLGFVNFQGHDFSYRGMSGSFDAIMSGAAHLTSFMGTDTIPAIDYLEDYYGATGMIGGSIPATEHSVMCMGGEENEIDTFKRLITEVYPNGFVSIVSDTWDFWAVITQFAKRLKGEILARDGKLVFRPDSGDPVKIIIGDDEARRELPAHKGAIECLWDTFGGGTTPTGYKSLDSHVGTIYGDSINLDRATRILDGLALKGFWSGSTVFGIGSYTYQYVTRDTYGTAMKATYGIVNGEPRNLFKAPKTDDGTKNSARGLLRVEMDANGEYVLHELQTPEEEAGGLLEVVFENSKLTRFQTLADIQTRLHGCTLESLL